MTTKRGKHYEGRVETIDAMETVARAWSDAGQPEAGLCFAQVVKYLMRPGKGQPADDVRKAADYLYRAASHIDGRGGEWPSEAPS